MSKFLLRFGLFFCTHLYTYKILTLMVVQWYLFTCLVLLIWVKKCLISISSIGYLVWSASSTWSYAKNYTFGGRISQIKAANQCWWLLTWCRPMQWENYERACHAVIHFSDSACKENFDKYVILLFTQILTNSSFPS